MYAFTFRHPAFLHMDLAMCAQGGAGPPSIHSCAWAVPTTHHQLAARALRLIESDLHPDAGHRSCAAGKSGKAHVLSLMQ